MSHYQYIASLIGNLLIALLITACSDNSDSPEAQIRQFIDNTIKHTESRNYSKLSDMVAKDYRDQKGFNQQQLLNTIRAYSLRHKNIYLLSKIESIQLQESNRAFIVVFVAMTGRKIESINSLTSLSARIYRFELQLVHQDKWQLQQANWKKSDIQEMLE